MSAESLERHGPAIGPWQSLYLDPSKNPYDFVAAVRLDIELTKQCEEKPAPDGVRLTDVMLQSIISDIEGTFTDTQKKFAVAVLYLLRVQDWYPR